MIRLGIVDDHAIFVSGLSSVLARENDMQIVATYNTGQGLLQNFDPKLIDIVLVDVNLPDAVGIQVAQRLQNESPRTGVVFLTMFSRQQTFGNRPLQPYTKFVAKDEDVTVLIKNIRELYAEILSGRHAPDAPPAGPELTEREQEILDRYRQGLNVVQIANELNIRKNTVSTHLKNIREKLGVQSNDPLR